MRDTQVSHHARVLTLAHELKKVGRPQQTVRAPEKTALTKNVSMGARTTRPTFGASAKKFRENWLATQLNRAEIPNIVTKTVGT